MPLKLKISNEIENRHSPHRSHPPHLLRSLQENWGTGLSPSPPNWLPTSPNLNSSPNLISSQCGEIGRLNLLPFQRQKYLQKQEFHHFTTVIRIHQIRRGFLLLDKWHPATNMRPSSYHLNHSNNRRNSLKGLLWRLWGQWIPTKSRSKRKFNWSEGFPHLQNI